jgi:hypothetical protein
LKKTLIAALLIVAAASGVSIAAATEFAEILTPHLTIRYSDDVAEGDAKRLASAAERAFEKVTRFLKLEFPQKLIIEISGSFPNPKAFVADRLFRIPANRIDGTVGGPPHLRCRGPAIYHAITRLVAGSAHPKHGSMLTVGLGVYLEEQFKPAGAIPSSKLCQSLTDPEQKFTALLQRSYPTMGRDLHEAMGRALSVYGRFIPVAEAERERNRRRYGFTTRVAELTEGSFVRFLIEEKGGLTRFLRLHKGGSFDSVYGKDLSTLEAEWQKKFKR